MCDALERAGTVVYLRSNMVLNAQIPLSVLDSVTRDGAYFATTRSDHIIDYFGGNDINGTLVSESLKDSVQFLERHMNAQVQGYSIDSDIYRHLLLPHIECAKRRCAQSELYVLSAEWRMSSMSALERKAVSIRSLIEHPYARPMNTITDQDEQCFIINRSDFVHTTRQLPNSASKRSRKASMSGFNGRKTLIALGLPITSKQNKEPDVQTIPFSRVFIPSLLKTIESEKYRYVMYMGFDEGDSFYDVPANRESLRQYVQSKIEGYPIEFQMVRVVNSNGWVPFIWNVLFQHAIDDGCDYFYQLNDDIEFVTPGWTSAFVNGLKTSSVGENVGVIGPRDDGNARLLTQAFVHRNHYAIFGYLYPYVFRNWYSDDWITKVYQDIGGTIHAKDFEVVNVQNFGTRYHICNQQDKLASALELGRKRIKAWIGESELHRRSAL